MEDTTRNLLNDVVNDRLQKSLNLDGDDGKQAFKEAMEAVEKLNGIDKTDLAYQEHYDKLDSEDKDREFEKEKLEKNREFETQKDELKRDFESERDQLNRDFESERDELNRDFETQKAQDEREHDLKKVENEQIFKRREATKDRLVNVGIFAAGLVIGPVVETAAKKALAKFIGEVEQMEYFTSSAGKSISSWFRWKK